jgi:cell wall-associated NlpC family hydrolase
MNIRDKIIAEAESWIRTPWMHERELKGVGVDCAQFLKMVYSNCGLIPKFKNEHYSPQWFMHRSEEVFLNFCQEYADEVQEPLPGDAVLFKWGKCFAHGGIVINWPEKFIHADSVGAKCVAWDDARQFRYRDREKKFFRIRGIDG